MEASIRSANYDDLGVLVALIGEHATFERAEQPTATTHCLALALFGAEPPLQAWLAHTGGKAMGYMTATRDYSTWRSAPFVHLDCLFIRAKYRGQGLGGRFIDTLKAFAAASGVDELQWQTPEWNESASRFYARLGATQATKRRFTLRTAPGKVV